MATNGPPLMGRLKGLRVQYIASKISMDVVTACKYEPGRLAPPAGQTQTIHQSTQPPSRTACGLIMGYTLILGGGPCVIQGQVEDHGSTRVGTHPPNQICMPICYSDINVVFNIGKHITAHPTLQDHSGDNDRKLFWEYDV